MGWSESTICEESSWTSQVEFDLGLSTGQVVAATDEQGRVVGHWPTQEILDACAQVRDALSGSSGQHRITISDQGVTVEPADVGAETPEESDIRTRREALAADLGRLQSALDEQAIGAWVAQQAAVSAAEFTAQLLREGQ